MKHLTLFAALLLCSNAQAATYVYQANAYHGHDGCGRTLLPFQLTITVHKAFPPNSNLKVRIETVSLNAGGGKYQWQRRYTRKDNYINGFTTNSNGDITEWDLNGATSHRRGFYTFNETGAVEDGVEFKCGGAGNENSPGTWKRTK
jgi:hypothetical protein